MRLNVSGWVVALVVGLLGGAAFGLVESGGYNFFPGIKITDGARGIVIGTVNPNSLWRENSNGFLESPGRISVPGIIVGANDVQDTNGTSRVKVPPASFATIRGTSADSASAVGVVIDNSVTLATNGSRCAVVRNNGVDKGAFDLNGLYATFNPLRREAAYQTITSTDTAFTAVGIGAATLLGGITATADTTNTAYQMLKYTTGAVSGNPAGVSGPFTTTSALYLPLFHAVVMTDPSLVTSQRVYVGLVASSLDQIASLAATNAVKYCAFRFDTTIGDAAWQACSSEGTTASCTTTGVSVAAATAYRLTIDNTVSGTCDFYVNGASKVNKTTNINATSTALGIEASITTLAAAARSLSLSKLMVLQN